MYDPDARFDGDAFIPTLEVYGLARVPGYNEANPDWRQEWFGWRDEVVVLRDRISALCSKNAAARADELALCSEDPARWLAIWGWINEPRPLADEDPIKPYAPFAFQVDLLQWFTERAASPRKLDGFVTKARGLGASWIFCAGALWGWLFRKWGGLLVSRKQDLVDNANDINSLFGKIDFLLDHLPRWMRPEGFNWDEHRGRNKLVYPRRRNVFIFGEATSSKTGRGARSTYTIYDEAAFIEGFKDVWNTGSLTTRHRFGISTESYEEGRDWENAWQGARNAQPDAVKELNWYQNAYQDQAWYDEERAAAVAQNDVEGFEREVERNPRAGFGAWIYPMAADLPIVDDLAYDPTRMLLVGLDPGHADDTGIAWGQLRWVDGQKGIDWLDSYERNLVPPQYYAHLLTGIEPAPEDECWGLPFGPRERDVMAFFRSLPWGGDRVRVFMDPAGNQKHNGLSFFDVFSQKTLALRRREQEANPAPGRQPRAITPIFQALKQHNLHHERRHATRSLLMHSRYAASPGAMRIRECLVNRKFQKETEKTVSEPKPIHDDFSHVGTAVEYVSVYTHFGLGEPPKHVKPASERKANPFRSRRAA